METFWTLIWLIITINADGSIDARLYESEMTFTEQACYDAQDALDEHLLAEGYDNFTTSCEEREL